MRQRATLLKVGAAATLVTALAACAPGKSTASNSATASSSTSAAGAQSTAAGAKSGAAGSLSTAGSTSFHGQQLTYVYFSDGPDIDATTARIAEFEKATGATVKLQVVPFANLQQTLQARLSGSNAPEVARVADWHPYADQLVDLTKALGSDFASQFVPGLAKVSENAQGDMVAVPSDLTINGPFINVDAFNKAGVAIPTHWTWDELIADAKKVQAANKMQYAFVMDESGHRMSTILSEYGTNLVGTDGKDGLDPTKATKALTMLTDLVKTGAMSKDYWLESGSKYKGGNDMFLAQAVPVYLSGNWQVAAFAKTAKFKWAAVPNPCEERCGGFPGGKYMVAFKNSKNPQLGAYFVNWMNSKESQAEIDPVAGWMPTRADLVQQGVDYPANEAAPLKVFLAEVSQTPDDTYSSWASAAFTPGANALVKESQKVVAGQEDDATAIAHVQKAVDAAVAQAG